MKNKLKTPVSLYLVIFTTLFSIACSNTSTDTDSTPFKVPDKIVSFAPYQLDATVNLDNRIERQKITIEEDQKIRLYNDSLSITLYRFKDQSSNPFMLYILSAELGESRKITSPKTGDRFLIDSYDMQIDGYQIEILKIIDNANKNLATFELDISKYQANPGLEIIKF